MAYTIDELKDAYNQGCLFTKENGVVVICEWSHDGEIIGATKRNKDWMLLKWSAQGAYYYTFGDLTCFDLVIKEPTVETIAPEEVIVEGTVYYVPVLGKKAPCVQRVWKGSAYDKYCLAHKLVYTDKGTAIKHFHNTIKQEDKE